MKSTAINPWLLRVAAFSLPMFTVFYSGIYGHPDEQERRYLQLCLLTGFLIYILTGIIYLLT